MTARFAEAGIEVDHRSEMVAIIAYLQRLGKTNEVPMPALPAAEAAPAASSAPAAQEGS